MPVPVASSVIHRRLLRDQVYDYVLQAIVGGALLPGQPIREADIERATGASRTPVREALALLRSRSFVDVRPQRGTAVARLNGRRLADCLEMTYELVCAAIEEEQGSFTDQELESLRTYASRIDHPAGEVEAIMAGALGSEVVEVFIDRLSNSVLRDLWDTMRCHIRWLLTIDPRFAQRLSVGPRRIHQVLAGAEHNDLVAMRAAIDAYFLTAVSACQIDLLSAQSDPDGPVTTELPPPLTIGSVRTTLGDQAYCAIESAIRDGVLLPGERLREDELVRWLGISKSPIKEALGNLGLVGLVETLPGKFCRVTPWEGAHVAPMFAALGTLADILIAGSRFRYGNELDRTRLLQLRDDTRQPAEVWPLQAGLEALIDLIEHLAAVGGNVVLMSTCAGMRPLLSTWAADDPRIDRASFCRQLGSLVDALLAGEQTSASRHLRQLLVDLGRQLADA